MTSSSGNSNRGGTISVTTVPVQTHRHRLLLALLPAPGPSTVAGRAPGQEQLLRSFPQHGHGWSCSTQDTTGSVAPRLCRAGGVWQLAAPRVHDAAAGVGEVKVCQGQRRHSCITPLLIQQRQYNLHSANNGSLPKMCIPEKAPDSLQSLQGKTTPTVPLVASKAKPWQQLAVAVSGNRGPHSSLVS